MRIDARICTSGILETRSHLFKFTHHANCHRFIFSSERDKNNLFSVDFTCNTCAPTSADKKNHIYSTPQHRDTWRMHILIHRPNTHTKIASDSFVSVLLILNAEKSLRLRIMHNLHLALPCYCQRSHPYVARAAFVCIN